MKPIKLRCERSICLQKDLKLVLLISKKTCPFYLFENQFRTRRIIRLISKEILSPNLIFSVSGFAVTFNCIYKTVQFPSFSVPISDKVKTKAACRYIRQIQCLSFLLKTIAWNLQEVSTSYLTGVLVFGRTFGESLFMMTLCDDFYKDRTSHEISVRLGSNIMWNPDHGGHGGRGKVGRWRM